MRHTHDTHPRKTVEESRALDHLKLALGAVEQATVERVRELRRDGLGLTQITIELNRDPSSYPPPPGKCSWDVVAVAGIDLPNWYFGGRS